MKKDKIQDILVIAFIILAAASAVVILFVKLKLLF